MKKGLFVGVQSKHYYKKLPQSLFNRVSGIHKKDRTYIFLKIMKNFSEKDFCSRQVVLVRVYILAE